MTRRRCKWPGASIRPFRAVDADKAPVKKARLRPKVLLQAAGKAEEDAAAGRNLDIGKVIEQQPAITLAELKPGEPVVVVGAAADDMTRMRAITLVAGVDPILRAAPQNGPDPLGGNWNFGGELAAPQ